MIASVTVMEGTLSRFVVCFKLFVSYRKWIKKLQTDSLQKEIVEKPWEPTEAQRDMEKNQGKYVKYKIQTGKKLSTASAPQVTARTQKLLPKGSLMEGQACLLRTTQVPRNISSSDQCRGDRDRTGGSASRRGRSYFVLRYIMAFSPPLLLAYINYT